jgi:hypothetical protein
LSYFPVDGGEDRIRTNSGALRSEVTLISLPGKLEPPAGRAPASQRYKGCASLSTLKRQNGIGEKFDQSGLDRVSDEVTPISLPQALVVAAGIAPAQPADPAVAEV